MKKLDHPNVVKLVEVVDDPEEVKILFEIAWKMRMCLKFCLEIVFEIAS